MRMVVVFLGLCAVSIAGCSRTERSVVAVVDGIEVPADEFGARLKTYLQSTGVRDNILLRKQIVTNMANEILILSDIAKNNWDEDPSVRKRFKEIEHQAILDQVAKNLVAEMQISESELHEEFRRLNTRVAVRYVYGATVEEALTLKKRLERGAQFETVAKETFDDPGLANNGGYLGYMGKEDLDEEFAETALSLPVGTLSDPVKIQAGYAIVRVDDRKTIPLASESDYAKVKDRLEETVRRRKTKEVVEHAARKTGESLDVRFHDANLDALFRAWSEAADEQPSMLEGISGSLPLAEAEEICRIGDRSLTLHEFLMMLDFVTEKQKRRVKTRDDLKNLVIGLETRKVLLEQATEKGLEKNADVISQIENARKSYLLKRWARLVQDQAVAAGIEESELLEHFQKNNDQYRIPPEVNVAEILVRTQVEAERMMIRIKRGESFSALARKHSIRTWAAKRGGELGYGSLSNYGTLAAKFFNAKVHEIIGPEVVDPYVGIFKVLGHLSGRPRTFEESKEEIRTQMLLVREQEAFKTRIDQLRANATILVHEEVLASVRVP